MIHIFSKSCYKAEMWALEHRLRDEQYTVFIKPELVSGLSISPLDRVVVIGVVSQFMLNAIQASMGKPDGMPDIEFYP